MEIASAYFRELDERSLSGWCSVRVYLTCLRDDASRSLARLSGSHEAVGAFAGTQSIVGVARQCVDGRKRGEPGLYVPHRSSSANGRQSEVSLPGASPGSIAGPRLTGY